MAVALKSRPVLRQTHSPTALVQAPSQAQSSTSATYVLSSFLSLIKTNNMQLPWSTSNEDLVDLFTTIGPVKKAEIQYEPNGRSKGAGVVEFDTTENAETAISKFSGYQYGGRPLQLSYVRYGNAANGAGGGDAMDTAGGDDIM